MACSSLPVAAQGEVFLRDHPGAARILEYSIEDLLCAEDEGHEIAGTIDEGTVAMNAALCRVLAREVENVLLQLTALSTNDLKTHVLLRCPLCPFRAVSTNSKNWKARITQHVRTYHMKKDSDGPNAYVPAGTKLLNLVKALFDHYQLTGVEPHRLLERASNLVRAWVVPPLDHVANAIDNQLALVLTGTGPQYRAKAIVQRQGTYRQVGYTYYDVAFFKVFLDLALVHHGRMKAVRNALISTFVAAGSRVTHLLPVRSDFWMRLLEDVIRSPFVRTVLADMMRECVAHQEFRYIAMDGTIRCAMRLKGQASYRCSADVRNEAAIPDAEAVRRVLTVRGRTGAVLSMQPVASENAENVREHLSKLLSTDVLDQVEAVATDMPSHKLYGELRELFPNLRCLSLDPVHIAITYNNTHWKKITPGQDLLRRLQAKFNRVDYAKDPAFWGDFFDGTPSEKEDRVEVSLLACIEAGGLSMVRAWGFVQQLNDATPWHSKAEYLEGIAALVTLFPEEVRRKTVQQGRTLRAVLHSSCAGDRLEWLFNNIRLRRRVPPAMLSLLGSGTSPNESLHKELNTWFKNQTELYSSTLGLQLEVVHIGKLVTHNAAMYRPTLRQLRQDTVLRFAAASVKVDAAEWRAFCRSGMDGGKCVAVLQRSTMARIHLMERIRARAPQTEKRRRTRATAYPVRHDQPVKKVPAARVCKRPAGGGLAALLKRPVARADLLAAEARPLKRTPFSLKRV